MDRNTVLIAFAFAALAALFASIGFRGQERHLAAQSERSLAVPDAQEGEGLMAWLASGWERFSSRSSAPVRACCRSSS